ncbi:hypothetical protein H0H81_006124 [Sphagnurus paluster]|uniref:Uncharacterized protein n=1 Tax=Sphagnurus paluster TaxID=117069 RepID=A0A9P7KM18_9AGAR|nr:hypothetical protein H0H81_006124 [Sphagnurus paluster]
MSKVNYNPQPGEGTVWFDYFLVTDPNITSSGSPTPSPSSTGTNQKDLPVGAIVGAIPFVLTAEDSTLSSNPNSTSTDNSQYSPGSLVTIPPPILPSRKSAIREYGSHQSMRATIIVDNADSHAVETQPEPVPGPSRDIQEPERVNIGPGTVHSGRKNHRPNVNISTDAQAPSTSAGPENTSNPAELVDVPPPVQHVDSGVRDSAIEPVELPPVYSPT